MIQPHEASSDDENGRSNDTEERTGNGEAAVPDGTPVKRPDPTRYGDWEKDGRCIDF